jgi:ABC-type dipeptide/oligopeptide/nickel transport system permease component
MGVPSGVAAAVMRNTPFDLGVMTFAVLWVSMPVFWFGILLIYVLGYRVPLFPMFGGGEGGVLTQVHHLVLPSVAVGARLAALVSRMSRSTMLEVLGQDYIRTARAKGLAQRTVIYKHALRNMAIPLVTVIGIDAAYLIGGTVVVETVFARAGLGKILIDAINFRDYPLVQGAITLFAAGIVLVNLITDFVYGMADPRVRFE